MGFNKYIKSGKQLELYEYENECFAKGRRKGYVYNLTRESLYDIRQSADRQAFQKYLRRKDNARRSSLAFKRIVLSNLGTMENPLLVTITFKANIQSITECATFFHVFIVNLRNRFGKEFRYIAVPEFQERGAVHYHALFFGFPDSVQLLADVRNGFYVPRTEVEKELFNYKDSVFINNYSSVLTNIHKQGIVFLKQTDGHERLSSYLAKYMVKAINDSRLFAFKAYFASRNIFRPVSSSGFPLWWVDEEFGLSTTAILQLTRVYDTIWLGKGRYKNYKLIE